MMLKIDSERLQERQDALTKIFEKYGYDALWVVTQLTQKYAINYSSDYNFAEMLAEIEEELIYKAEELDYEERQRLSRLEEIEADAEEDAGYNED